MSSSPDSRVSRSRRDKMLITAKYVHFMALPEDVDTVCTANRVTTMSNTLPCAGFMNPAKAAGSGMTANIDIFKLRTNGTD